MISRYSVISALSVVPGFHDTKGREEMLKIPKKVAKAHCRRAGIPGPEGCLAPGTLGKYARRPSARRPSAWPGSGISVSGAEASALRLGAGSAGPGHGRAIFGIYRRSFSGFAYPEDPSSPQLILFSAMCAFRRAETPPSPS